MARVFGRPMPPVPVAAPVLNGSNPSRNVDSRLLDRAGSGTAIPTDDAEGGGREKPRRGRILPDLLSAARDESEPARLSSGRIRAS